MDHGCSKLSVSNKKCSSSPPEKKAPNYKSAALGQNGTKESDAIGTWRKANVEATNIKENATPNTFEPAGNFLKTEGSLVVRSKRKVRFSEKYRDSVVGKILTGATTISKVRQDSELCEADIVNWIADKFRRTQMENEYLRSQLPEDLLSNEPVLSSTDEYSPATLTGAAKPK